MTKWWKDKMMKSWKYKKNKLKRPKYEESKSSIHIFEICADVVSDLLRAKRRRREARRNKVTREKCILPTCAGVTKTLFFQRIDLFLHPFFAGIFILCLNFHFSLKAPSSCAQFKFKLKFSSLPLILGSVIFHFSFQFLSPFNCTHSCGQFNL